VMCLPACAYACAQGERVLRVCVHVVSIRHANCVMCPPAYAHAYAPGERVLRIHMCIWVFGVRTYLSVKLSDYIHVSGS